MTDQTQRDVAELKKDVAELKRCVNRIAMWFLNMGHENIYYDLTTPPPTDPPKIEVVAVGGCYAVTCNGWFWSGGRWDTTTSTWVHEFIADAIAKELRATKNYPPGVQA